MNTALLILSVHYFADFIVQTDWQAKNKSSRFDALARHVTNYTGIMFALSFVMWRNNPLMACWAVANGIAHCVVDYFTSRTAKRFFSLGNYRGGFMVIGLDQLIHQTCLLWSWEFLYRMALEGAR